MNRFDPSAFADNLEAASRDLERTNYTSRYSWRARVTADCAHKRAKKAGKAPRPASAPTTP